MDWTLGPTMDHTKKAPKPEVVYEWEVTVRHDDSPPSVVLSRCGADKSERLTTEQK